MGKHVSITHNDDLTGEPADHPNIEFGLDGKQYEIDLSAKNNTKLREALAPYIAAARRPNKGGTVTNMTSRRSATTEDKRRNQQIREWAQTWGLEISDRGRIPSDVIDAHQNRDPVTQAPPGWAPKKNETPERQSAAPALVKATRAVDEADYKAHQKTWREKVGLSTRGRLSKANLARFEEETGILPPPSLKETG